MADWRDKRKLVAGIVHKTMGIPDCIYRQAGTGSPVSCRVRFHSESNYTGDSLENFSPGLYADFQRVILALSEIPEPKKNDTITFPQTNKQFVLDAEISRDDNYAIFSVRKK